MMEEGDSKFFTVATSPLIRGRSHHAYSKKGSSQPSILPSPCRLKERDGNQTT